MVQCSQVWLSSKLHIWRLLRDEVSLEGSCLLFVPVSGERKKAGLLIF